MKALAKFLILGLSLSTSSLCLGVNPDPGSVYFYEDIAYGGNGCPLGTVRADISEDQQAISVFLDEYFANVGPDTAPSVSRNCNLTLPIHIPTGWQYTLVKINYRGTYYLDSGVYVTQNSEYFFQGDSTGPSFYSRWRGPTYDEVDFNFNDFVNLEEGRWYWSRCNTMRDLVLRTRLSANNMRNRDGYGYIINDYIEAENAYSRVFTYQVVWRKCP